MNAMHTVSLALLAMSMTFAFPAQSSAETKNETPKKPMVVSATKLTATVEDVDRENRVLSLKGPMGRVVDVKVGAQVEMGDIKKGDQVAVEYLQSMALSLSKDAAAPAEFSQFVEVAPTEGAPGAVKAATLQVAATIEEINKETREVTVKGPKGKTMVLKADPEVDIGSLKKGDQIVATYTEAIAVKLKKPS